MWHIDQVKWLVLWLSKSSPVLGSRYVAFIRSRNAIATNYKFQNYPRISDELKKCLNVEGELQKMTVNMTLIK